MEKKFNLTFPVANKEQKARFMELAKANGITTFDYDDEEPTFLEFYGITQPMVFLVLNIVNER